MRHRDVMLLRVEQSGPLRFPDKSLRELAEKRCLHSRHLIFQVTFFVARIGIEVLLGAKLGRVDEDTGHEDVYFWS